MRTDKTITLFFTQTKQLQYFQCTLPVHQYTFHICQKVLLFQSNRIPGHVVKIRLRGLPQAIIIKKTSFREGAASDVETGRSRWVPGRVSKVGETAVQTRCP